MKILRKVKKKRTATKETPNGAHDFGRLAGTTETYSGGGVDTQTVTLDPGKSYTVVAGASEEPFTPTPLPRPAAPVKSVDAPLLGLMREGDSLRIAQPLLKALVDAIAGGYDTMRITQLERLPDGRWQMALSPDTYGYGAAQDGLTTEVV